MIIKKEKYISWNKRLLYSITFIRYGILLNPFSGIIKYIPITKRCKCEKLIIMRHGKTIGVERHEFMSNTSTNTQLSEGGINDIKKTAKKINEYNPDVIIVATLSRTIDTYEVLKKCLSCNYLLCFSNEMIGIDNGDFEGKCFERLDEDQLFIFLKRECSHDVFIKTQNGDSWADVIYRSIKVINYINKKFPNKKILLISQGSIYQALKIVMHNNNSPWEGYSALKMFNITNVSSSNNIGYSCLYSLK